MSWRALAITISKNKAKDALKKAGKGLHGTAKREPLRLVSGDAPLSPSGDEPTSTIFELQADPLGNPEDEYLALHDVVELRDLAFELLTERDRGIFLEIHFGAKTRKELGEELGLTPQRIGQIYDAALEQLEAHPRFPYRMGGQGGEGERS